MTPMSAPKHRPTAVDRCLAGLEVMWIERRPSTRQPSGLRADWARRRLYSCLVVTIQIVQLDRDLDLPAYAHPGDAGLDLQAREDGEVPANGGRLLMPTGISIAIPAGYGGFVLPRSGLALKHGLTVANAPGLIDSAYRGEIKVILLNTDPASSYLVHRGDRIAQLVIQQVEEVTWQVSETLAGLDRGGGFGHSGR
jgi:dUTP pyrophosphatase